MSVFVDTSLEMNSQTENAFSLKAEKKNFNDDTDIEKRNVERV